MDWVEDIAEPFFKKSGDYEAEEGIGEQSVLFIGIGNEGNRTLTRAKHLTSDFPTLLVSRNKQLVGSCKLDSLHIEDENKSWGHLSKYISNQKLIIISACYYKHNRTVEQNTRDIDYILSIINECRKSGAIILSICSESVFVGEKIPVIEKELIKTYQDSLDIRSHSTIFINQNNLLNYVPNLPIDETYSIHDQLICDIIIGMFEASKADEVLGGDFSDVLTFLSHSMGPLRWFYGESDRGEEEVLTEALNHPLCELLNDSNEYPFNNVTSMLALITGGLYFTMGDAFDLLKEIKKNAPNSTLIYSINQHTAFDDSVRLQLFLNYEHVESSSEAGDDKSFNQSAWEGVLRAADELGAEVLEMAEGTAPSFGGGRFGGLRSRNKKANIGIQAGNKGTPKLGWKKGTHGPREAKPNEEESDPNDLRRINTNDQNTEFWIQDGMDFTLDQEE